MGKFTEEEINNIINIKGDNGEQINIFNLHGLIFVGNSRAGKWDLNKKYIRLAEHNIPITIDTFEHCENEDDVRITFSEELNYTIIDKLL